MPACERCDDSVRRRYRCHACLRLCCVSCLEWPGAGMARDGIRWCFNYRDREDDCKTHSDVSKGAR